MEAVKTYELTIIGGGPAGLTAAIYSGRALVNAVLLERGLPGGQAATSHMIANYPGFPGGIGGPELAQKMEEHAREFGVEVLMAEVSSVAQGEGWYLIKTSDGVIKSKALLVATGSRQKRLGVPEEDELRGKGLSYCATCDGAFFQDRDVVVVGGGDSAVEEAGYLTRFVSRVYLVHRRDQLRAAKSLVERARQNPKIYMVLDSVVTGLKGKDRLEGVEVTNVKTHETRTIAASGIFVYVGLEPNTEFIRGVVDMDQQGYIITTQDMETSAPGVFAAGDVRSKSLRQVATAVGDGALAAVQAGRFLEGH
ncbi:MAG: thioredoxin-disulfide reductase [Bacillota bacterium]